MRDSHCISSCAVSVHVVIDLLNQKYNHNTGEEIGMKTTEQ